MTPSARMLVSWMPHSLGSVPLLRAGRQGAARTCERQGKQQGRPCSSEAAAELAALRRTVGCCRRVAAAATAALRARPTPAGGGRRRGASGESRRWHTSRRAGMQPCPSCPSGHPASQPAAGPPNATPIHLGQAARQVVVVHVPAEPRQAGAGGWRGVGARHGGRPRRDGHVAAMQAQLRPAPPAHRFSSWRHRSTSPQAAGSVP